MAADASGTFADDGVSDLIAVRPNESVVITIDIAGVEEFVGKLIVERSSNAQAWETVENDEGDELAFDGTDDPLTGAVCNAVCVNESPKRMFYRIRCTEFDGDDALYTISQVVGDAVEVILRDHQGQPVLSRRDDGGIKFHAPIAGPGEGGELEVAGPLLLDEIALGDGVSEKVIDVLISAASIIDTAAGGFGHANGYPLVPAAGAGVVVELVSAVVTFDRAVAAYTAGGNITINESGGGAALTGLVSAANSLGNAADKVATYAPLAAAGNIRTTNTGLNLVSSAAFTNPGTAAGVIRAKVRYREVVTGL